MTREELEREIKNYIDENCNQWETDGLSVDDIVSIAVLDFAEPREKRIADLEDKLANADYQLEGRDNEIRELNEKIEKMRNCGNCKYGYCGGSSISIDKDGNRTFHNWNEEKQDYCDVGKNGKYQCWELRR